MFIALSACGRSNQSRDDARPADDAADADVADAAPAGADAGSDAAPDAPDASSPDVLIQTRITVALDGQPRAGDRILINRADGTFFGEGVTDAAGEFAPMMPDGGSLTWVRTDLSLKRYYTYAELHDGYVVNTGTPPPAATGAVTPISITRTNIPNAVSTTFGVDRFPDQMFTGNTFSYPTTATGTVSVIQDGADQSGTSVGYSSTTVAVAPSAAATMPSTIHQALDLVVDVVAPVLQGGLITATVVPFQKADSSTSRQDAASATGAVSITFPRFVYGEASYLSSLHVYFETPGAQYYEQHFTHYIIDSSVTHASYGVADLAECPRSVVFGSTSVTIGQPPSRGDFAHYGIGRWTIMVPFGTTSFARLVVPADLASEFAGTQSPLMVGTIDSGDIGYREALTLQRSTHYGQYSTYTGDGHPYMRECWRFQ